MLLPTQIEKIEDTISYELRRLLLLILKKSIKEAKHYTILFTDIENNFILNKRYKQLQMMQYQIVNDPYMLSVMELILENVQDSLPKGFYNDKEGIPQNILLKEIDELLALKPYEIK